MAKHLVLIGLPGAGKTTVGRLVAERLGTHFTDIDPILERSTGQSIAELFAGEGEPAFRVREHRAVLEALRLPPHVIAPGGGWAAVPGNLDEIAGLAVPVHLAVDPEVAAERLAGDHSRPLLAGDPAGRLRELAGARLRWYRRAPVEVPAAGDPSAVADRVAAAARAEGGW